MADLNRFTIRLRLLTLVACLLAFSAALGTFALDRMHRVDDLSQELADRWLVSTKSIATAEVAVVDAQKRFLRRLLTSGVEGTAEARGFADAAEHAEAALAAYRTHIASETEQKLFDEVMRLWQAYRAATAAAFGQRDAAEAGRGSAPDFREAERLNHRIEETIDRLLAFEVAGGKAAAERADAIFTRSQRWTIGAILFAVLAGFAGATLVVRSITAGIRAVSMPMSDLARGDLDAEIPYRGRKTELGIVADALHAFKLALIDKRAADEAAARDAEAKLLRANRLDDLTRRFEDQVGRLSQLLSASATEMEATAQSMSAIAEETDRQAVAVAAASEQASTNVHTVAGASEELAASIHEIAGRVAQSAEMAARAVEQANRTDATVRDLATAGEKIGSVLELITSIARQTNLLALNATIEAARAGDAGKGFAVVATEVKNLAGQTATATEEIAGQIGAIQSTTRSAVEAIQGIGATIEQISQIAAAIASAVEQQRAATEEISRNVQEAARGTQEVTSNIAGVKQASADAGAAASQVLSAAGGLAEQSETLNDEVRTFIDGVRAA